MSRVGASLLKSAGLDRFVAREAAAYVRIAIELAHDEELRRTLRAELRPRLRASALLDHTGFTRKLEAQCRTAWGAWCDRQRVAMIADK
jgi:predicted O-linked N-acetylglucosamine transferase (SPINDLY family)